MNRAKQRADTAIRLVDELLSGRGLQRSKRKTLLMLRRELQELRDECDVGKRDHTAVALRWAILIVRLYEFLDGFLKR